MTKKTKEQIKKSNSNIHGKYRAYKASAEKRNLVFELTKDDFKSFWQKPCYYCDAPIELIGIDRKDNSLGYILDNCLSCCKYCNKGKSDSTYEEYIERCRRIAEKNLK